MLAIWLSYMIATLSMGVIGCEYKLQSIQMIYRHGDRAPIFQYPNDPNPITVWKAGLGNLTLLGKRQHWSLGLLFRSHYNNFITTSPTEINVMSAVDDRCMNSAATNLASFYSPKDDWMFYSNVHWQPIPIHYMPSEKVDKYLSQISDCPKAAMLEKQCITSPENKAFDAQHKEMYDYLSLHSGKPIKNWFQLTMFHDTLLVEKIHNLKIPSWVIPYWDEIEDVASGVFYRFYKVPEIQYFRGGPLLGMIVDKMIGKVSGDLAELKVQVYSAHDSTVAVILGCLNMVPTKLVPYAATLIFELYSEKESEKEFVRLLYLNSTEPETANQRPNILIMDGCQEYCPLDYFIKFTKKSIPKNWEKECQL
ncbi:lysosomal acid phosphatase isoform X2 [Parasteatoda tepidariorum]|uniref:lysosomal acid phosphatase isoform X2 n=1 Tax=Parasteatoda tepidariorum TaxID=114398 RepID=UPI0039BC43A1